MTPACFDEFRAGRQQCPSDLRLWRLHVGELHGDEGRRVRRHTEACPACLRDLAGLTVAPETDTARMLATIRARLREPAVRRDPPRDR